MKRQDVPFQRHWLYYLVLKIRGDRGCGRHYRLHRLSALHRLTKMPRETFLGMRTHHMVIGVIAIVVAVALVSNFYLW
jgi:hypothetical protein